MRVVKVNVGAQGPILIPLNDRPNIFKKTEREILQPFQVIEIELSVNDVILLFKQLTMNGYIETQFRARD